MLFNNKCTDARLMLQCKFSCVCDDQNERIRASFKWKIENTINTSQKSNCQMHIAYCVLTMKDFISSFLLLFCNGIKNSTLNMCVYLCLYVFVSCETSKKSHMICSTIFFNKRPSSMEQTEKKTLI